MIYIVGYHEQSILYLIHTEPCVPFATICHNTIVASQRQHQAASIAVAIDGSNGGNYDEIRIYKSVFLPLHTREQKEASEEWVKSFCCGA